MEEEKEFIIELPSGSRTSWLFIVPIGLYFLWEFYSSIRDLYREAGTRSVVMVLLLLFTLGALAFLAVRNCEPKWVVWVGPDGLKVQRGSKGQAEMVTVAKEDGSNFLLYTRRRLQAIPKSAVPEGFEEAIRPFIEDEP